MDKPVVTIVQPIFQAMPDFGRLTSLGLLLLFQVAAVAADPNPVSDAIGVETSQPLPGEDDADVGLDADPPLADVWPTLAKPWLGDLDGMVERGKLRVLTVLAPGFYSIDRGRPRGALVESLEPFEKFAKKHLGESAKHLKMVVIPVRRDQLLPFLVEGYGDIAIAQLKRTPRRLDLVDFSDPFRDNDKEFVIAGLAAPDIETIDDLAGQTIAVREDSSYFDSLTELNERFREEGKAPVEISLADPRLGTDDLLDMVHAGLLPATVADDFQTALWTKVFSELRTSDQLVIAEGGEVGPALRKDSPQLKALMDGFVATHRLGMTVPNVIVQRYRDRTDWVEPALKRKPFHRLQEMEALFKKYGEQYGFDWLLLASFAFQESGFNQKARSQAGAIGVMQVLPSTAADRSVGIANIHSLENNIHAGTKYLSVLRDRYFADEALDPMQRALFTMAGYNAGPNRINRLRAEAEKRELDPNRWFGNVELVVAATVGREPVQYVGNIYKYFVAYKRVMAELDARNQARASAEAK
jgi:membrane-bound lytic murein transglycosylase MltF